MFMATRETCARFVLELLGDRHGSGADRVGEFPVVVKPFDQFTLDRVLFAERVDQPPRFLISSTVCTHRGCIPDPCRVVDASRDDLRSVRAERHAKDTGGVAPQREDLPATPGLPDLDRGVPARRGDPRPIGAEGQTRDPGGMPFQDRGHPFRLRFHDLDIIQLIRHGLPPAIATAREVITELPTAAEIRRETHQRSWSEERVSWPVTGSQIRQVSSPARAMPPARRHVLLSDSDATCLPSSLNATRETQPLCPEKTTG